MMSKDNEIYHLKKFQCILWGEKKILSIVEYSRKLTLRLKIRKASLRTLINLYVPKNGRQEVCSAV